MCSIQPCHNTNTQPQTASINLCLSAESQHCKRQKCHNPGPVRKRKLLHIWRKSGNDSVCKCMRWWNTTGPLWTHGTEHRTQNTFILKGSALKHRSDTEVIEGTELWMLTKNYVKYLKIQIQFSKSGLQLKEIKFTKNPGRVLDSQKRRKKKNLKVGSRGEKKKIIMTKFSSKFGTFKVRQFSLWLKLNLGLPAFSFY